VSFAVMRFAHREVVREGHEADTWRYDTMLHGQGDGGDATFFYRVADQPDGPVAQGSRRREQHDVYLVFYEFAGDFGSGTFYQRGRVVDGSHKGEVACRESAHCTVGDQSTEGLEGKDGVQIAALIRPIVGVGPGEVVGCRRYLTVGAITGRVVDIEARLVGQVNAACGDEREA
jgi:hypothetical protein